MRSCVDFPEPSDHSTMMRVQGRSSVEKNISFEMDLLSVFLEEVFVLGVSDDFCI
jgi:hypothetical protein